MAVPALTPGMAQAMLRESWGVRVTSAWAKEQLQDLASRRPGMDKEATIQAVWDRWLDSDVRVAGVTAGPVLPVDIGEALVMEFEGNIVLMVVQAEVVVRRSEGPPPLFSLSLTDGFQLVKGVEEAPWLEDSIPFGTKVQLRGLFTARRGVIILKPDQVELIGGEVKELAPPLPQLEPNQPLQPQHTPNQPRYHPYSPQQRPYNIPQPQLRPAGAPRAKVIKATCSLVSATEFCLVMPDPTKLPGAILRLAASLTDNRWTFALKDHAELQACAVDLLREIRVAPLPAYVLATFLRPSTAEPSTIDLSPVEPHLLAKLLPYQKEGVQYGVSRGGRVLIGDEMGLGKTVQALALTSYYHGARPVLVVAPSSVTFVWRKEVLLWLPALRPQDVTTIATAKDDVSHSQFVIISYNLVTAKKDELMRRKFQFVILDESHMVKEASTARYKAVEPLARSAAYLVLLSGTPALSRPIELYAQVRLIDENFFTDKREFGERYCDLKMVSIGRNQQVENYTGASNTAELALLLRQHCMVRRIKQDVRPQLSQLNQYPKQRIKVELAVVMEEGREEAEQEGQEVDKAKLLLWFAATARAKLPAVQGHLRGQLAAGGKFLVFCHHQVMVGGVVALLEEQGEGFVKIDGAVGNKERARRVDRFQTDPSCRVAVLSLTAANTGLTLTEAKLVVFAELYWDPCNLLQAEDRAHRIGQTSAVTCQYLVARGTADDYMWPMVQAKLEVLGQLGLTRETFHGE